MVDLTKFSKTDLKETVKEINTYLKKVDETDFDPNETTPEAEHLEEELGGTSEEMEAEGKETEKSVKKDDTNMDMTEQMTEPSQNDVMYQILELLQEINGKLNKPEPEPEPEPVEPEQPPVDDQIQQSATPTAPTATPATSPAKSDININVTKQVEQKVIDVLKSMGLTPSKVTQKPKTDSGHPIEKGNALTYEKIKKLSWDELNNINTEMNPGPYY